MGGEVNREVDGGGKEKVSTHLCLRTEDWKRGNEWQRSSGNYSPQTKRVKKIFYFVGGGTIGEVEDGKSGG